MYWPRFILLILICGGFIILGIFATRKLRLGPVIHDLSPSDGESIDHSYIEVMGSGDRIAEIFIDDMRVLPTITGDFSHALLLSPGINIVTVRVLDKFEKQKVYTLRLWGDFNEYDLQALNPLPEPIVIEPSEDSDTSKQATDEVSL